ncbi:MAG TPA: nuclear transport factor 2 family protein [Lacunisphaera sp.]|nr:nuclear transport factor 2 family protein [Lacunisphaera sp.]
MPSFNSVLCSTLLASGLMPAVPSAAADPSPDAIIKAYFAGWEQKDWDAVAGRLANGFTFTSPAPDDHLPVDKFKAKCWNQAEFIERFEFPRIAGDSNSAFAIVHVITKDGRIIRNTEYFTFEGGKIKSIEVFFGGNGKGYPSNK